MRATAARALQPVGLLVTGALVAAGAVVAGRALPFPRPTSPGAALRWVEAVGAPVAAFTALRAVATGLVVWAVVSWLVGVGARLLHHDGAVAVADRLSLPAVRRLAATAAAVVALSGPSVAGAAAPPPVTPVTMVDLGPSLVDLGVEEPASLAAPTTPAAEVTEPPVAPATWVIAPGDTLWHVAEATAPATGPVPTAAEVVTQLQLLVELNAERLLVPGDPDLVVPGQEFLVP